MTDFQFMVTVIGIISGWNLVLGWIKGFDDIPEFGCDLHGTHWPYAAGLFFYPIAFPFMPYQYASALIGHGHILESA